MTKKQLLAAGGGLVLALALGTGLAAAQSTTSGVDRPPVTTPASVPAGDHDAMHEQMRAQMPDDLQAQCDTTHAQMGEGHGIMMQGSGMGSTAMMGSAGMTGAMATS